ASSPEWHFEQIPARTGRTLASKKSSRSAAGAEAGRAHIKRTEKPGTRVAVSMSPAGHGTGKSVSPPETRGSPLSFGAFRIEPGQVIPHRVRRESEANRTLGRARNQEAVVEELP